MDITQLDEKFMKMAIEEAKKGLGFTSPNPAVGAVIVKDNRVVGKGYHKRAGTPHAEVNAIKEAGGLTKDATIYVTLEPCNHTGRTPPCTKAILDAGIKRAVIGARDPNPKVAGGGAEFLADSGLDVTLGVLEKECKEIIAPFVKHINTGIPWIRSKVASSLDGRIATRTGHSKWITNEKARGYGQYLRRISDAILVGRETALKDNPRLTFRAETGSQEKVLKRIILDSSLSLPPDLNVFNVASSSPTILITTKKGAGSRDRIRALEKMGVRVLVVDTDENGRVELKFALKGLGEMDIQSILVEGGATIHGSFWDKGLVDEAFFFFAPIVIGGKEAPSSILGKGVSEIGEAKRLREVEILFFDDNFLVHGYVNDINRFWSQGCLQE